MDSVTVTVPLRPPIKKMKKRKELDALAFPRAVSRRSSGKRSSQELLSDSSDDRSEYWHVSTTRVGMHKVRNSETGRRMIITGIFQAWGLFLTGTVILITTILVWLFIDVCQQLTAFRVELDQVIAGSEGIPDALQTCHILEKNFKTNLTHITDEIKKLNRSLNTFSDQISNVQEELRQVQVSLKSAPELTSVPTTVKALQNSIGELEINIHDLQAMYQILNSTTLNLQYSQDKQIHCLKKIKNSLMEQSNMSQLFQKKPNNEILTERNKLWNAIEELHKNLTFINQTLAINITWTQEDLFNDHKKIVSLQDMTQNSSAQILTLQKECIKRKDQEILQNLLQSLSNRVDQLSSKSNQERSELIEQNYKNLKNSTDIALILTHEKSTTVMHKLNKYSSVQEKNEKLQTTTKSNYETSFPHLALSISPIASIKQE